MEYICVYFQMLERILLGLMFSVIYKLYIGHKVKKLMYAFILISNYL